MSTNGTEIALETRSPLDTEPVRRRQLGSRTADAEYLSPDTAAGEAEDTQTFALAPLVDKIAYGIARGLVVAVKELEHHIAAETRKVGDSVDRRLDALQISMQELSRFVVDQRSTNSAVEDQLRQLTAASAGLQAADTRHTAELESLRDHTQEFSVSVSQKIDASTASLQEADARQVAEIESLRVETRTFSTSVSQRIDVSLASLQESDERQAAGLAALKDETKALSDSVTERIDNLCKELGVHQEDIAAAKTTLSTFCSRVDTLVARLDRQADVVRSMYAAYSQRETELQQLLDMLAKSRAYPATAPASGL